MRVITHQNIDIDAVSGVWAYLTFVPEARDATIVFRSANYDGHDMGSHDVAIDLDAGGRGIKGQRDPDGTQHSCFATIVAEHASPEDQAALHPLVTFIDAQDSYGNAFQHLIPGIDDATLDIVSSVTVSSVLRALQSTNGNNDHSVISKMLMIFDGLFKCYKSRQAAEKEADEAELLADGQVAIVNNSRRYATNGILFKRGVRAIVFIDDCNLGVVREGQETFRADDPRIRAVVEATGEFSEWFAHSAGFLFARGTRKAPQFTPSQVDPHDLAQALVEVISAAA